MNNTVKIDGEPRMLTHEEITGLRKIHVAVNAEHTSNYLVSIGRNLSPGLLTLSGALKLPREAEVEINGVHTMRSAAQIAMGMTKGVTLPGIYIDTKFSNDGSDLKASVDGLRLELRNFALQATAHGTRRSSDESRLHQIVNPVHISFLMHHMADPEEVAPALEEAKKWCKPVAVVSSSKQKKSVAKKYGFDRDEMVIAATNMALDSGFTHLSLAAVDTDLVVEEINKHPLAERSKIHLSGSGVIINEGDVGEHNLSIEAHMIKGKLDTIVEGAAILLNQTPGAHMLEFARAVA